MLRLLRSLTAQIIVGVAVLFVVLLIFNMFYIPVLSELVEKLRGFLGL